MTPEQRAEFERRIIQRAFDAGVVGCDVDAVLCDIAKEFGLHDGIYYSEWEPMFESLVERGILREEGVIPADFLALSYEEWGKRIATSLGYAADYARPHVHVANMLRGKVPT